MNNWVNSIEDGNTANDHCNYIEISSLKQISEIEHDCLTGEGGLTSLTQIVSVRMSRKLFFSRLIIPIL